MKKVLIAFWVIVFFCISFLPNVSAVTEEDSKNYKYIPKVVTVDGENKMIFDAELAKVAHGMCEDTYKIRIDSKAEDIAFTMKKEGFVDIKQCHVLNDEFKGTYTNNFLVGAKTFIVDGKEKYVIAVAFRGTTIDLSDLEVLDLFTNVNFVDVNGYHAGFYSSAIVAFDELYDMKFESLKDDDGNSMSFADVLSNCGVIGSDYSIVVTGHSLGGAVANIFAGEILGQISKHNVICYTFAAPKVCSSDTAKKLNAYNIFNIINTKDVVPDVGYLVGIGTRPGENFYVTEPDLGEKVDFSVLSNIVEATDAVKAQVIISHDLSETYAKALEQVIDNIDSHYPYIHRTFNNGKDETHIHSSCEVGQRDGLNFLPISDLILYKDLTCSDLNLGNVTIKGASLIAPDSTISLQNLVLNAGSIRSTVKLYGDLYSYSGEVDTLHVVGDAEQTLIGTLDVKRMVFENAEIISGLKGEGIIDACKKCNELNLTYETKHPHMQYKFCSCGNKSYTENSKAISDCGECHQVSNIPGKMMIDSLKSNYTTEESIVLVWTESSNATEYALTVKRTNDNLTVFDGMLVGNSNNLGTLKEGTYSYVIRGHNSAGKGPPTSVKYFTVEASNNNNISDDHKDGYLYKSLDTDISGGYHGKKINETTSADAKVVGCIPYGEYVVVTKYDESGQFGYVNYQGKEGWVYLSENAFPYQGLYYCPVVTFNANGGNVSTTSKKVYVNATYGTLPTPLRAGYIFEGWYTTSSCDTKITNDTTVNLTSNQTLHAAWRIDEDSFVLTIGETKANVFGKMKYNDVAPVLENNRTMLPVRFIAENLGATTEWIESMKCVFITKGNTTIEVFIGNEYARINGKEYKLDSPAFIRDNRTYIPVRFICENLGADVEWNDKERSVVITLKQCSDDESVIRIYNVDEEELVVPQDDIEYYTSNGWYTSPVITMYAADGRTNVILKSEIDEYKSVGWYLPYKLSEDKKAVIRAMLWGVGDSPLGELTNVSSTFLVDSVLDVSRAEYNSYNSSDMVNYSKENDFYIITNEEMIKAMALMYGRKIEYHIPTKHIKNNSGTNYTYVSPNGRGKYGEIIINSICGDSAEFIVNYTYNRYNTADSSSNRTPDSSISLTARFSTNDDEEYPFRLKSTYDAQGSFKSMKRIYPDTSIKQIILSHYFVQYSPHDYYAYRYKFNDDGTVQIVGASLYENKMKYDELRMGAYEIKYDNSIEIRVIRNNEYSYYTSFKYDKDNNYFYDYEHLVYEGETYSPEPYVVLPVDPNDKGVLHRRKVFTYRFEPAFDVMARDWNNCSFRVK